MKIDLPKKDKNGKSRLSYSQIATFKKSKDLFYDRYILLKPFVSNPYVEFGSKVGKALQHGDFTSFDEVERKTLSSVTRLELFELPIKLEYTDFNVYGYIDTCSMNYKRIIDYKTGGKNKEGKYMESDYNQLQIYALALRQMHGVTPQEATVEFIRRGGNLYRGERLRVEQEPVIQIDIDISKDRLMYVYRDIYKTAIEISKFYSEYKPKEKQQKLF